MERADCQMPFNASWTSLHRWQTHSPDFSGGASSRRDNTTREFQRPRIAHVVVVVGAGGGAAMPKSHIPRSGLIGTWPRNLCFNQRSEEHTSELQSRLHLVCRLLLEKK